METKSADYSPSSAEPERTPFDVKFLQELDWLIDCAHENAVQKGFWKEERNDAECIALMHSELSEMLEECRKGGSLDIRYIPNLGGKPEGVIIELADVLIRIFDWLGARGIDAETLAHAIYVKMAYNVKRPELHGKVF